MKAVLVPGVLALLPRYASLSDPVAELRAAATAAVDWLAADGAPIRVLADAEGVAVADHLLANAGARTDAQPGSDPGAHLLVIGNGSARRTLTSPGPFDERAVGFDDKLGASLRAPDPGYLRTLSSDLAAQLWARIGGIAALGAALDGTEQVSVDLDDDSFGVQWWVMRWQR